ncbi:MAG: sulfatase, partial [Anaerolineae bacterium]|nr:sulfatase [Anaerolineae bacterium]
QDIQLADPFTFTKGCRTMKIDAGRDGWRDIFRFGTMLFDLDKDPQQNDPINDLDVEQRMVDLLLKLMQENDAPEEQFTRLGLD